VTGGRRSGRGSGCPSATTSIDSPVPVYPRDGATLVQPAGGVSRRLWWRPPPPASAAARPRRVAPLSRAVRRRHRRPVGLDRVLRRVPSRRHRPAPEPHQGQHGQAPCDRTRDGDGKAGCDVGLDQRRATPAAPREPAASPGTAGAVVGCTATPRYAHLADHGRVRTRGERRPRHHGGPGPRSRPDASRQRFSCDARLEARRRVSRHGFRHQVFCLAVDEGVTVRSTLGFGPWSLSGIYRRLSVSAILLYRVDIVSIE
jgi:hypothetical protein